MTDCENRIYEDIDRNSIGSTATDNLVASPTTAATIDSGFSGRRQNHQTNGSDDSWGSGEFETFSSDESVDNDEDDNDSGKVHSPTYVRHLFFYLFLDVMMNNVSVLFLNRRAATLRALLTGRSIRDRLRGTRNRSREEDNNKTVVAETTTGRITSPPSGERRFSRIFSIRRSSSTLPSPASDNASSPVSCASSSSPSASPLISSDSKTASPCGIRTLPLPQLLEEEEIMAGLGLASNSSTLGSIFHRRHQPPTLPPVPPHLSAEQLKRRYIVATIIHSENSYVASLQRLVNVSRHWLFSFRGFVWILPHPPELLDRGGGPLSSPGYRLLTMKVTTCF